MDRLAIINDWFNGNLIFTPATLAVYWHGFVTTVQLVFIALLLGLILSLPLAILRTTSFRCFRWPIQTFIYVFRGTPLLIQLYIAYYGFAYVPGIQNSFLWFFVKDPLYPCLLAFTLNTTAYTTEIFTGAIRTMPKNELEAARAYGLSRRRIYQHIVLPSALRRVLPSYGNEVIFMLHASAIASVVTIMDLTGAAYYVYSRFYAPFAAFGFVALLYMILSLSILGLFRHLEHRLLIHSPYVATRQKNPLRKSGLENI